MKPFALTLLTLLVLSNPGTAQAHPVDEFGNTITYDQRQILEISPRQAKLTIQLILYPLDKNKIWESIDINKDREISQKEKDSWMIKGQDSSWLELDGTRYDFSAHKLSFPGYYAFYLPRPANVSIEFETSGKFLPGQIWSYHYQGKDKKLGEFELSAKGTEGLKADVLEKVESDSVKIKVSEGQKNSPSVLGISAGSRINIFLNTYVKVDKVPTKLAGLALVAAFVIGMLHALTPGHGKAIVAGYLVGEKGTITHAVQLGLIITITHTASVFILGLLALLLTQYIVPVTIIKWLNVVSGILVTGFGLYLLVTRIVDLFKPQHEHLHPHLHEDNVSKIDWKNLMPLGISGGIVPCVDALAILVVAVSVRKILFGIILLVIFSLGLASALVIGGVLVVVSKKMTLQKIPHFANTEKYISILSAVIVTGLGLAILLNKPT